MRSKYNLVLVFVEDSQDAEEYLRMLAELNPAILQEEARVLAVLAAPLEQVREVASRLNLCFALLADEECATTHRMLGDGKRAALCVADRFGEVYFLHSAESVGDLPPPQVALDWLTFIQIQCPE